MNEIEERASALSSIYAVKCKCSQVYTIYVIYTTNCNKPEVNMLVNLEATTFRNNKDLLALVEEIKYSERDLDRGSNKAIDKVISQCRRILLDINRKIHPGDVQTVVLENDNVTIVGAIECDANLKNSYDPKAIIGQIHIDMTMVTYIHSHSARRLRDRDRPVMLHIPNKLAYDPAYFNQYIFLDYLMEFNRLPRGTEVNEAVVLRLVHLTAGIVKGDAKLSKTEVDNLTEMLNVYGVFIMDKDYRKFDIPEKYVISQKWFDKVTSNIKDNPYFIARHVWRCYFRLCKEGYIFNA